jgi:hypothetical protein
LISRGDSREMERKKLSSRSWPSVEVVPSWATTTTLSSALAGVVTNIVVPRWVAVFAAQLVGNELLYAVYLWATKDSLPPPLPSPRSRPQPAATTPPPSRPWPRPLRSAAS